MPRRRRRSSGQRTRSINFEYLRRFFARAGLPAALGGFASQSLWVGHDRTAAPTGCAGSGRAGRLAPDFRACGFACGARALLRKALVAGHDRAGRAGGESSPGSARPYSPWEDSPPSRLQCRGWGRLGTVMRSRRRADHTFTVGSRIARTVSVANSLALRGVPIRLCPTQESVVAPQSHARLRVSALRCHDEMCGCCWRMCTPRRVNRRAAETSSAISSRRVTV